MATAYKALGMSLDIPMIAMAQLKRRGGKDGRTPKPVLQDLGESSYLEKDADMVFLLHPRGKPPAPAAPLDYRITGEQKPHDVILVDYIVAKHRIGAPCTVSTLFNRSMGRFESPPDPADQFAGMAPAERTEPVRKEIAF
jgi:replicative DNA helicase